MKKEFQKVIGGIYRLKVPFEDLYTSVFLIENGGEYTLVDCATTDFDVDEYIEPALNKLGLTFFDLTCVIITHNHGDHIGGLSRALQKKPKMRVIKEAGQINRLEIYPLHGHTKDLIGVFEPESKTLISSDGLQGAGVGKYRCSLEDKQEYLQTIAKIEQDERIENILFSHAYEPWLNDCVFGRANVKKALQVCKSCAEKIL